MVNYPTKKKTIHPILQASTSKRGMNLEEDLNQTNQYYLDHDIAIIHKKPTPITVVSVHYPSRSQAKITEAYYKVASTTDYNGVFKGIAIDFEAKETQSKTAFSLSNIHDHQIKHMQSVFRHHGIAFLIVRFTSLNETYLLYIEDLIEFVKLNTRKSIPLSFFKDKGHTIDYHYLKPVDYLKVIQLHKGSSNENPKI